MFSLHSTFDLLSMIAPTKLLNESFLYNTSIKVVPTDDTNYSDHYEM